MSKYIRLRICFRYSVLFRLTTKYTMNFLYKNCFTTFKLENISFHFHPNSYNLNFTYS